MAEGLVPSEKQCSSRNWEALDRKFILL